MWSAISLKLDDRWLPKSVLCLRDYSLNKFLHDVVAGITGLDPTLVRPRWQENPPNLPLRSTNWAAIGVVHRPAPVGTAVATYDPTAANGEGALILIRQEDLELLCSFYGPNCQGNGAVLRDGLYVGQNREALFLAGMGLGSVSDLTKAPEMIKSAWYQRADLTVVIRREVRRQYPVLSVVSGVGTIVTEQGTRTFNAETPGALDFTDPANSGLLPGLI